MKYARRNCKRMSKKKQISTIFSTTVPAAAPRSEVISYMLHKNSSPNVMPFCTISGVLRHGSVWVLICIAFTTPTQHREAHFCDCPSKHRTTVLQSVCGGELNENSHGAHKMALVEVCEASVREYTSSSCFPSFQSSQDQDAHCSPSAPSRTFVELLYFNELNFLLFRLKLQMREPRNAGLDSQ